MNSLTSPVFMPANFLLPNDTVNLSQWSVIACDQHTSELEYWLNVKKIVGDSPSTLHIIFPEVYLDLNNNDLIHDIHRYMLEYRDNILNNVLKESFIYVQREMQNGNVREGLVGSVDLEQYSYKPGEKCAVRPTEDTVQKRIPPRLAVRKGACLETSHILMLLDDPDYQIIEPLGDLFKNQKPLYDVDLMLDGGNIKGWAIQDKSTIHYLQNAIQSLGKPKRFHELYRGTENKSPFTLAVGDGNHSLATAKAYWEELKVTLTETERKRHPARYCMVELENIRSTAIEIEPIHRIMYHVDDKDVWSELKKFISKAGSRLTENINQKENPVFKMVCNDDIKTFSIENSKWSMPVGMLEEFFTFYQENNPKMEVDYIHGEDTIFKLSTEQSVGFILPDIHKGDIFRGVAIGGTLPRKTFSMGVANEKRYYMECKKITE